MKIEQNFVAFSEYMNFNLTSEKEKQEICWSHRKYYYILLHWNCKKKVRHFLYLNIFHLRSKMCIFSKIDEIGKISKGRAFIYLRNKWTKRYPYFLPSAHTLSAGKIIWMKRWGGHGSHGMFLRHVLIFLKEFLPFASVPNIFFIYFLEDVT